MFDDEEKIQEIVYDFCEKNNLDKNMFEISKIARSTTGWKDERIANTTPVKNKKCTFVAKYYLKLDLIVIWNYKANKNMNYSLKTIKEKLSNGIRFADKGTGTHTSKQYIIYFEEGNKLKNLLHFIFKKI